MVMRLDQVTQIDWIKKVSFLFSWDSVRQEEISFNDSVGLARVFKGKVDNPHKKNSSISVFFTT